ncbi:hypothetical protein [Paenibacillus sanguinis]|uniref:hypothetical protein n=1 Tax=Paenibacillus sanguinis TaxID=225906 RepID=UPI0003A57B0B|nr:hypothetical protein [Paenibacillus sanguinis]
MPDWLVQFALATLIGIIGFFLKSHKAQQDKMNEILQAQIDKTEAEFQAFRLLAADQYVHKDDFIRATAQTDRKLDKIYDEIIKLSGGRS